MDVKTVVMPATTTQLTLRKLKKEGWVSDVAESYNHTTQRRKDLFGFIDVVAIRGKELLAIQTTDKGSISTRVAKICGPCCVAAYAWLCVPGANLEVWGWGQSGHKQRWDLTVRPITLDDIDVEEYERQERYRLLRDARRRQVESR